MKIAFTIRVLNVLAKPRTYHDCTQSCCFQHFHSYDGRLRLKCDGTRAEKPNSVFAANRTSPFKSAGWRHFCRLLAAEVCTSAVVMLDTTCYRVVWRVLANHSIRHFPFASSPVRHRVPSHFNWTVPLTESAVSNIFFLYPINTACMSVPFQTPWFSNLTAMFLGHTLSTFKKNAVCFET